MSDLSRYFDAQTKLELARSQSALGSANVELASIRCRMAQLKSQSEPLHSMLEQPRDQRDMINAAIFFVVIGRWPELLDLTKDD